MLVKMAVAAVRLALLDPGVKWLVLALAVWVVVSALHGRIRRRDAGLAKLMASALLVLAFSTVLRDRSAETLASFFAAWAALLVLCVRPWWKFPGAAELLRGFSMGMLGCLALRHPRIETYALALAVWIALSAFSLLSERPERDGADTASEEVGSSSSIPIFAKKELGVFLSFNRGPDIPDAFIDFLTVQLTRSGISVFGHGIKLPEGEELVEVIRRSNVSIPIISKGYASSESCLVELGLMLECRRTNGQTIIPIFYDVDPSDVRLVRGSFEISLKEHEMKGMDGRTIDAWGRALRELGDWDRFYSADNNSWSNYKLLKQLLLDVLQLFSKWDVKENLVGIQDRVQEVLTKLGVCYKEGQAVGLHGGDVRVVGIYGTGGVGKTTIAKVVYKAIASLFDGCSYLEDVRERFTQSEGLKSLQNQLISDLLKRSYPMFTCEEGAHNIRDRFHSMRVLIILDDVGHYHQLEPFIGKLSWFGPRSRIIVTTRDYGLINVPEVAERYEVEPLKPDQALFLFQRHASHVLQFPEGYDSLFDEIISVTGRIPLAIEVLAPLLRTMPTTLWQHTLKIMKKHVDPVERGLMASFEFLNYETKEILLDIACFFVGKDIANPFSMWCACGYDPLQGINVLLDMSLVQVGENNKLWMHNKLRNLCQQIVKNEDPERPERRSRLWDHADAVSMLKERKGAERVQALDLKYDNIYHDCFTYGEFELLPGLRYLNLGKARIKGDSKNSLSNLRWLDWQVCPETFGACDLHLKELVILDLSWSKVAHNWKGWSQIKMPQLRILNLTGCTDLLITPDFSGFEKLEILILEHCSRLVKIDASIAHLKFLVTLNLKFCSELSMLPKELNDMKEMKELLIDGTSIKEIPSTLANMKKLKILSASNCFSLSGLPQSLGQLVQLKQISLRNCRRLGELPDSIGNLGRSLIELDVSGTGICNLPGSITNLRGLKVLKMDSCFTREFPCDFGRLTNLEEMHALRCRSLEGDIPSDVGELKSLRMLVLGYTCISSLPPCIQSLCCLQTLDLLKCDRIEALPILPSSLTRLRVTSRRMKAVPFIDNLTKLEELCLGDEDPEELKLPSTQRVMNSILTRGVALSFLWPKRFLRLKVLELSHSRITDLRLRDKCLPQLTKLVVSGANLRRIQQLPSTLSFLSVRGCLSLKRLPTVQCLKSLNELRLSHSAVREVEGLGELGALEIIDISHCEIRNLKGLGQLTSLISLTLSDCDHLQKLPDISNLKMLKILEICRCREIKNIQGPSPKKKYIFIQGLQKIRSSLGKLYVGKGKDEDSRQESYKSAASSPTSITFPANYEVFLSFRGLDTRKNFTDCLYTSLTEKGIRVFRDNEELPVGKKNKPSLIEAIKQSKIAIPIISEDYASSKSCLMELQQILECRENNDQMIIPIFYHVNISDVKHLTGSFGESFNKLVKNKQVGTERIDVWKKAFRDIGEMKGCNLAEMNDGHHGKLIQLVVSDVLRLLKKPDLVVTEYLVGIDHHVEEIMRKLDVDFRDGQAVKTFSNNGCVVGICGMPGVGKTTLAKIVYNRLYHLFDGCAYLENVREKCKQVEGLKTLRCNLVSQLVKRESREFSTSDEAMQFIKHRFSNMKVLIFLDDVDDSEQLTQIVDDLTGYGPGSRIIVTSLNKDVLKKVEVKTQKYELEAMDEGQALQLFYKHAFGKDFVGEVDGTLSRAIISATGRLPLALEMVGSCLFLKPKEVWEDTLEKLKDAPHEKVEKVLKMCYEDLDENQKKIFLDVACFLFKSDKRIAIYMWDDCKFFPREGIEALLVRSLVKVGENNELWMHDQLRNFGRELVRKENPEEPFRRSRLWNHKEALATLKERKGTEKVQALELMFDHGTDAHLSCEAFYPLWNLRFLKLDCAYIEGNLQNLLANLRWLDWQMCPEKTLGLAHFNVENLIILDLSWSRVNQGWSGWELIGEKAKKLKVLNLTGCLELLESPEFSAPIKLERLILECCSKLYLIGSSIKNLGSLVSINMKSCCNVDQLPDLGFMTDLKELVIDGTFIDKIQFQKDSMEQLETLSACKCERLEQIYEIDHLRSLSNLALDGAAIKTLPVSIGSLEKLQRLSLRNCQKLTEIPRSIGKLKDLQFMDLSNTGVDELPYSVKHLENLKVLKMEGTHIKEIPEAIQYLPKLEEIDFSLCRNLEIQMDSDFAGLASLRVLKLSYTQIPHLPESVCCLLNLQMVDLRYCKKLQALPKFRSSVIILR